jgi:hypothetical protein
MTAGRAHQKASRLRDSAQDLARRGDAAEAFAKALRGWQLVRPHTEDPECVRLELELSLLVERLGEAANAKYQGGNPVRTIGKSTVIE